MAEWVRLFKKAAMLVLLLPLRLFPVKKDRVLLHNDAGRNYSDSPKAVAEYLQSAFPGKFQIVFSVGSADKMPVLREKGLRPVRFNSFKYFFYAMTSRVFLTNSGGFSYLPLHKSQYVINVWHGSGPYKRIGLHMYGDTPLFRADLKLAAKKTDVFLSSNTRFTKVISEDMLLPRSLIWEIGSPRNDQLIHPDAEKREEIRKKLGLAEREKLILYAPTYRKVDDDYFKDCVTVDFGVDPVRVCAAMEKRFGGKWRFAFRMHPRAVNRDAVPRDCMDLSGYEDMQELLLAADAMINDFSSSMWDFMLMGKPCFVFAADLRRYIDTTGVYTPVEQWPFPISTDNDELEKSIIGFDEAKYAADCRRHYEQAGGCETGEATKLVCERIYEVCFGNNRKEA